MAINESLGRRTFDRRIFTAAAVLFPMIVFAGFARTYYLKGFFATPPLSTVLVHIHGILMSAWVLLFVSQVWLVSSNRVRTHQRMGFAGIAIAIALLLVGFFISVRAAKFGAVSSPPNIPRLAFLLIPLTDLFVFATFFGAAIFLRKKPAEHKRLMLLTAMCFIPPAIARIPIPSLQAMGPIWFLGFPTILILAVLAVDAWHNKRVNKVFLIGTLFLIASFVLRLMLMGTDTWMSIAQWLVTQLA